MDKIIVYDTTLRDGAQTEGVSFSMLDKISIALKLDDLGVDYIEGGYPVSNPKEVQFFTEIKKYELKTSKIVAFGSTRKKNSNVTEDPYVNGLLASEVEALAIVAKAWDLHVKEVLRVDLEENINMIKDTVEYLKQHNREVIFDAEHFFDGFKENADFALACVKAAADNGADCIVLCDTNGGCLPNEVYDIVTKVRQTIEAPIGIHAHNDGGLAIANSVMAVHAGAVHVQGTINGLGERCGNADLCAVIPNIMLKAGKPCLGDDNLKKMTEVSRFVSEMTNFIPASNQPFVGLSAFAHKGGLHIDAIKKNTRTYEHISPDVVGNERRILISELSGTSTILAKAEKYGVPKDKEIIRKILNRIQNLENEGYQFEAAEASFYLLVQEMLEKRKRFFDLEGFRVIVEKREDGLPVTEATIKIKVGEQEELTAAEGDGPVNALDLALRKALEGFFPDLKQMRLVDYKVRVIDSKAGTAAKVRVIIESRDMEDIWSTVGVSENLIEASWLALLDSVEYKLQKDEKSNKL